MRLVKFIKFYIPKKPLTPKQIKRYEKHIRKVMEDFEEVWGDDLDWLDLVDNHTQTDDDLRIDKKTSVKTYQNNMTK